MKILIQFFNSLIILVVIFTHFNTLRSESIDLLLGIDNDGDGFSIADGDCDDTDPFIFPFALETCNGKDDDCNGEVDEDTFKPFEEVTISLNNDGERNISPSDLLMDFNIPCGIEEIQITPAIVNCSNIGTLNVRIKVITSSGRTYTSRVSVILIDNTAPVITAYWGNHFSLGHGTADPTQAVIRPDEICSYTDNCGVLSARLDRSNFTCADIGFQWVLVEVEDNYHNISNLWILIHIESGGPQAICHSSINVALPPSGTMRISADMLDAGSNSPCGYSLFLSVSAGPDPIDCRHVGQTHYYNLGVLEIGTGKINSCWTAVAINDPGNFCTWGRSKADDSINEYTIYPNPINEFIIVERKNNLPADFKLTIQDINGKAIVNQEIKSFINSTIRIETTQLNPGMYFLILEEYGVVRKTQSIFKN